MKIASALSLASVLVLPVPSLAGVVTLTFEGIANGAAVGGYYSGLGVSFVDAVAVSNPANASGEPTPPTVMTFPQGSSSALMTVADGFTTGFSLYYSSSTDASVYVYDKDGGQLGSFDLSKQNNTGCTDTLFCNWSTVGLAFSGTAYAVDFTGTIGQTAFDNLTLGSSIPNSGGGGGGGNVPEPSSIALAGLALAGLLVGRSRHARAISEA